MDEETAERAVLKTAPSERVVPLPDVVANTVSEHLRVYGPGEGGLIFKTRTNRGLGRAGGPVRHHHYQDMVKEAAHKIGLPRRRLTTCATTTPPSSCTRASPWWPWPSGWETPTPSS